MHPLLYFVGGVAFVLAINRRQAITTNVLLGLAAGTAALFGVRALQHNQLPGGRADGKSPADFDLDQLNEGVEVELEHTSDRAVALEIAMDHLTEDPKYYDKLLAAGL